MRHNPYRHIYFLIFLLFVVLLATGFVLYYRHFFLSYQREISANVHENLVRIAVATVFERGLLEHRGSATLIFTGDVMLSRSVAIQVEKHGGDYAFPFEPVRSFLRGADILFGNLENPVSLRGANHGSIYSFRADPGAVRGLSSAGYDVLSVANNHIWDWGVDALIDTVTLLEGADISPVGAGKDYAAANAWVEKKVNGVKIGFLAFTNLYPKGLEAVSGTPGISSFDEGAVAKRIREAKENGAIDLAVVSFHWGDEYKTHSNAEQERIARGLVDAGTDIVVGHHPHVVEETEHYRGGWIFYSLGNFVFDQYFSEETMEGMVVKVAVRNKKVSDVEFYKSKQNAAYQVESIMPFVPELTSE